MLKSRLLRLLVWASLGLLLLWALVWLALPPLLKWQLETRGSSLLGRELRVGEVHFDPLSLALTLRDLSIGAADVAAPPQLHIERLFVDLGAHSLLRLAPVVEAIEVDAPRLRIARLAGGGWDFDDLLQRFAAPPGQPAAQPARFALFNLQLARGEIHFDDRPVGRKHELSRLTLNLPFLSNLPDDVQVKVEPRLAFELNGSAFASQGQSTPFARGRASALKFSFDQLDLRPGWAYLPPGLPVQPAGGTLSAELSLRFEQPDAGSPQVDLQGQVELRDLAVNAGDAPLLAWRSLRVRLADVRPLQRRLVLDALQLDGAVLHVRREASGGLEFERLAAALRDPAANEPAGSSAPAGPAAPSAGAAASAASRDEAAAAAPAKAASAAAPAGQPPQASAWQVQLALLELNAAQVHWSDAAVTPGAALQLGDMQLRLKGLRWPVEADAGVEFDAGLRDAGRVLGQLHADGTLSDRQAKLALRLTDIDLAVAAPYLRATLRPQLSARIDAAGDVDWARGEQPRLLLGLSSLRVEDLRLADAATPVSKGAAGAPGAKGGSPARGVLLQAAQIEVAQLRVDALQRRVAVGAVSLQRPFIDLARDAAGAWNFSTWVAGEPALGAAPAPAAPPAAADAPWVIALRQLELEGGRVRFSDAALSSGPLELDNLRASAMELAWPLAAGAPPLATQLSARLVQTGAAAGSSAATPARLDWNGRVALEPAAAQGKLFVERFPVHVFEPYFGARLPLALQRLEAGFKGEIDLRLLPAGATGQVRGDALLADLRVTTKDAAGAVAVTAGAPAPAPLGSAARELLSWSAVAFSDLSLTLPTAGKPLLEIGTLRLADYYSRLEITEEGNFNLQTVAAATPGAAAPTPGAAKAAATAAAPSTAVRNAPAEAGAAAAPAGSGSVAAATAVQQQISAPSAMLSKLPIDLMVGATQIVNARVDFNDRFVRPNYSAELSELNGSVGRLDSRTRDLATLQVKGRVGGTGLLEIGGSINPTVSPPALDITAKAHDIELPGLTPYSSKYAGYPIERGKLRVDVAYRIESDGKLEASNRIVVDQLTFGPKTDSPVATKLPVRLAVALLQDRNGVIDLDLPLTGSIEDPQFDVWALIWKVLGNLISKAVTAPFSTIAGGKDLSTVEFEPGTARVAAASQDNLDKVAKALSERPGLKLGVVGQADAQGEKQAMQRAALEARLLDEQRREKGRAGLSAGADSAAAATEAPQALTPEERERALKRLYADAALPDKPRNLVGMTKDIPGAEMQALLEAAVPVDEASARRLAVQRGRVVREALIAKGLGSERLFLGEPKLKSQDADNTPWTPHAQLTLSPG